MNRKAVSLLEILISSVIIASVMLGIGNLFVASRRHILHSRMRMAGGELGKLFVDPLQMHVRQDNWDQAGNALTATGSGLFRYCDSDAGHTQQPLTFCPSQADRTLNGIEYSVRYEIIQHPQNANMRRVVATISWNEPTS